MRLSELTALQRDHLAWRLDHNAGIGVVTAANLVRGRLGDMTVVEAFLWAGKTAHAAKILARKVINFGGTAGPSAPETGPPPAGQQQSEPAAPPHPPAPVVLVLPPRPAAAPSPALEWLGEEVDLRQGGLYLLGPTGAGRSMHMAQLGREFLAGLDAAAAPAMTAPAAVGPAAPGPPEPGSAPDQTPAAGLDETVRRVRRGAHRRPQRSASER